MRQCPKCLAWFPEPQTQCPKCFARLLNNEYSSEDADDGHFKEETKSPERAQQKTNKAKGSKVLVPAGTLVEGGPQWLK